MGGRAESQILLLMVVVHLHDELGVVVAKPGQQISGPPFQEVVEGTGGFFLHADLILVTPNLHTSQRHAHIQGTVVLEHRIHRWLFLCGGYGSMGGMTSVCTHPVNLIGHIQQSVNYSFIVPLKIQKLKKTHD